MKMRILICSVTLALGMIVSPLGHATNDEDCLAIATHRESSGESLRGSRAVLDVIYYRMQKDSMTACRVIRKPGAFSWVSTHVNWKPTKNMLTRFRIVDSMEPVLTEIYYFNNKPFRRIGRFCCKIGKHFFYYFK